MKYTEDFWRSPIAYALFAFLASILFLVLWYGPYFKIDINSAHYVLSALIQSEAAIVALVITLNLVALQLAASYNSEKVTDLVRNNPHFAFLISWYIATMIFDVMILRSIGESSAFGGQDCLVNIACILGIYSFAILILYVNATLEMLRPSNIAESLLMEINKESFLELEDPLEDLIGILKTSRDKDDYRGVSGILWKTERRIQHILLNGSSNEEKEGAIVEKVSNELRRIYSLLTRHPGFPTEISEFLTDLVSDSMKAGFIGFSLQLMSMHHDLAKYVAKKFNRIAIRNEIQYLRYIIEIADESNCIEVGKSAISSLGTIAVFLLELHKQAGSKGIAYLVIRRDVKHILEEIQKTAKNEEICNLAAAEIKKIFDSS